MIIVNADIKIITIIIYMPMQISLNNEISKTDLDDSTEKTIIFVIIGNCNHDNQHFAHSQISVCVCGTDCNTDCFDGYEPICTVHYNSEQMF